MTRPVSSKQRTSPFQRLIRGAAKTSIIKLAGVGISFLFFLGLARLLDEEGFGVFGAGFSLALILGAVGTVGQHTAVVRFWPSFDEAHGREVATRAVQRSLLVSGCGGLLLLLSGGVLSALGLQIDGFGPSARVWIAIGALASAVTLSEVTLSALRAQGSVLTAFVPRDILWRSMVLAMLGIGVLPLGPVVALFVTTVVLWVLVALQLIVLTRQTPKLWAFRTRATLPEADLKAMSYAQWGFWGNAILSPMQQQGGTVIVALTLGPLEAGAFFAASRLANLLAIVQTGANQISGPMISRSWRAEDKAQIRSIAGLTALVSTVAALIGFIGFVFLGTALLSLFNEAYQFAHVPLLIIALSFLVSTGCGPNGMILLMSGHERILFKVKLVTALCGLALTVALTLLYDIIGTSVGAALGMGLQNIAGLLLCKRYTGIWSFLRPHRPIMRQDPPL